MAVCTMSHMWKAYCLEEVAEKEVRSRARLRASPHALCWHAERDDVAESPMEILTQTLMSGKELVCVHVCVDFSPLKLKEVIAICNVNRRLVRFV